MRASDLPHKPSFRRDLNEFLWYRNGEVEASKFWSNVGCGMVAYWMFTLPQEIAKDWFAWSLIATLLIAPDIARKLIAIKSGDTTTTGITATETVVQTVKKT